MRQQRRHAELGVARQHPEHGLEVGVEAVLLPDARAELVGHLVAQGVGDDDDGLLVAVADERLDVVGVERASASAARSSATRSTCVDLLLPGVAQLVDELVGVALLDLLAQRLQGLAVPRRCGGRR